MGRKIKYDEDINPLSYDPLLIRATFLALKNLGGAGTNDDIEDQVIDILDLNDEEITTMHRDSSKTQLAYKLSWERTRLKRYGVIDNEKQGYWSIRPNYRNKTELSEDDAIRIFEYHGPSEDEILYDEDEENSTEPPILSYDSLRTNMLKEIRKMDATKFEHLTGILLRACGFKNIEITPPSNDKGLDGTANLVLNDLVSIKVAFQCKRYTSTAVGIDTVNSLIGSANAKNIENCLLVTTDRFSKEARDQAAAANVVLIDGKRLVDLLIEKEIGCKKVRGYNFDPGYFDNISAEDNTTE